MALINCPECNKEVSSTALTCPHCGFGVAHYISEKERKEAEAEKQKEKQLLFAQKQMEAEAKREKKAAAKQLKSNYLKQSGKKSFWVFAALLPYSVISAVLPFIQDYLIRKQYGLLYQIDESIVSWLMNNAGPLLPMATLASFTIFLLPAVMYVIANNLKNIRIAKAFLICGLVYSILLFAVAIWGSLTNGLNLAIMIRFLIPLCFYVILYINARRIKI